MAFCEKCGKEIGPDGTCDCQKTQESTAVFQGQTASQGQPEPQGQSALQKQLAALKNKNIAIIIAAAAVLVLLVIIIAVAGSSSYKTPVKQLVKLINKQSTDVFAYQELMTDPISSDYVQAVYKILKKNDDVKEQFEDIKEDIKDFYKDYKGFKISSCDFVKAEKMKSKDLRAIQNDSDYFEDMLEKFEDMDKGDYEDLADELEISVSDAKKFVKKTIKMLKALSKVKVKDGYEVTLRFYGKYEGDSDKTDKIADIRIIKVNGTWYILDSYELFSGLNFDKDLEDVNLYKLYRYINGAQLGIF